MQKKDGKPKAQRLALLVSFLMGGCFCSILILNMKVLNSHQAHTDHPLSTALNQGSLGNSGRTHIEETRARLDGLRVLVGCAAYGLDQLPHLEELLDSYVDLCAAGAHVDVWMHVTHPYPVTLIDLLNSRIRCNNPSPRAGFTLTIVLKSPKVYLHLVDYHRTLFYDKIDEYDLFIYTEDDIRVTPKTVSAYLHETERVKSIVGAEHASDYNVGIARYEYNYPPDLIVTDKTRKITKNVTRVYWEHSWDPPIPKSVDAVPQELLSDKYVHMKNHHQGMFLATRELLKAWKIRPGCEFDRVRDRPGMVGREHQPSEGTQRVWMSSQMLYGNRHCNVQQVLPMDTFGMLTVLHLPNKNYRRHGKKGRIGGNGAEADMNRPGIGHEFDNVEMASPKLLTAMKLHIELRRRWPEQPRFPYDGIVLIDEVEQPGRTPVLEERMNDYRAYVARGGIMSEDDMNKTDLHAEGYK